MIRAEEYCLPEHKSQIEKAAESVGCGLAGFHRKGVLSGGSFVVLSLRIGQTRKSSFFTIREAPILLKRHKVF